MSVYVLNDTVRFKDKQTLIKTLLYVKLCQMEETLPDNAVNVLSLFVSDSDMDSVIQKALDRGFVKSWQSGDNTVSKLVKLKFLTKTGRKKRQVNPEIFPVINTDYIAATFKIHNIN